MSFTLPATPKRERLIGSLMNRDFPGVSSKDQTYAASFLRIKTEPRPDQLVLDACKHRETLESLAEDELEARLEQFVEGRNELAKRYDTLLTDSSFTVQKIPDDVQSSRHLYVVRVSADRRDAMCGRLRDAGISSNLHYLPVHLQPYYRKLGFSDGMFREAERYALEAITLPLFPQLTHANQDKVIRVLCH